MTGIRIGELARRTGARIGTIRYYEREGLISEPDRSEGNFRLYQEPDVERLRFIRHCRSLDMSLSEIRVLLESRDHPECGCSEVIALVDEHLEELAGRITQLTSLQEQLRELRQQCGPGRAARDCGILKELAESPKTSPESG